MTASTPARPPHARAEVDDDAAEHRDRAAEHRDEVADTRDDAGDARDGTAVARDRLSGRRDRAALRRDAAAELRDADAAREEQDTDALNGAAPDRNAAQVLLSGRRPGVTVARHGTTGIPRRPSAGGRATTALPLAATGTTPRSTV